MNASVIKHVPSPEWKSLHPSYSSTVHSTSLNEYIGYMEMEMEMDMVNQVIFAHSRFLSVKKSVRVHNKTKVLYET